MNVTTERLRSSLQNSLARWLSLWRKPGRTRRAARRPLHVDHLENRELLALTFTLNALPGTPATFIAGFTQAAALWQTEFIDNVNVVLNIGGAALGTGILGQASSNSQSFTYTQVRNALIADATTPDDVSAVANLRNTTALNIFINRTSDNPNGAGSATPYVDNDGGANNTTIDVNRATARALGLIAGNSPGADGDITFSTNFSWDFDASNGITAGFYDFVAVAAHEIGHILGFVSGVDALDFNGTPPGFNDDQFTFVTPLDLFRFSANSETALADIDFTADNRVKYFSVNGGTTSLAQFSTGSFFGDGEQASHWKDNMGIGVMDPTLASGTVGVITQMDIRGFDVIGWTRNANLVFNGTAGNDTFIVRRNPTNAPFLQVLLNGTVISNQDFSILNTITMNGLAGNDQLIIDPTFGNPFPVGGLIFDGGTNNDTVRITRDVALTTINGASLISGTGTVDLTGVENAFLTGGVSANAYVVNGYTGNVTIAAGGGADSLTVIGAGGASTGLYTPGTTTAGGLSGVVTTGGAVVNFSEFETAGSVSIQNLGTLTVRTGTAADSMTIDAAAGGQSRLTGVNGVAAITPLLYTNIGTLIVDAGNGNDVVTINSTAATGLQNLSVLGGAGDDSLSLNLGSFILPTVGGTFTFNGGTNATAAGDVVHVTNDVGTTTVSTGLLAITGGGSLNLTAVEGVSLTGGASTNNFIVASWAGTTVALNGAGGNDVFTLAGGNLDGINAAVSVVGGVGNDSVTVNDNGIVTAVNYTLGNGLLTSIVSNGAARTFKGLTFDAGTDALTLNGSAGANIFNIAPGATTTFNVNGNAPTSGGNVDSLAVNFWGTGGRRLVNRNIATGSGTWEFPGAGTPPTGVRAPINFTGIETVPNLTSFSASGSDASGNATTVVRYIDDYSGEVLEFMPYEATYRFGVRIVTIDLTGDNVPEIVTAPLRGRAPEIRVFDNRGRELVQFRTMAYAANYLGGVNIAVGNVVGDARLDLITAPARGVVEVRVFQNIGGVDFANAPTLRFNAFAASFIGGGIVAAGNLGGDARAEIIVGSGSGSASTIFVFNPQTPLVYGTGAPPPAFARYTGFFPAAFRGGIGGISVGQLGGTATPDLIVSQGQGGTSLVVYINGASGWRVGNVFNPTAILYSFRAYTDANSFAAVSVVGRDLNGDGIIDTIFTGQSGDGRTRTPVRQFSTFSAIPTDLTLLGGSNLVGYYVG